MKNGGKTKLFGYFNFMTCYFLMFILEIIDVFFNEFNLWSITKDALTVYLYPTDNETEQKKKNINEHAFKQWVT